MTQAKDSDTDLAGKRIAFVGKLGGMTRREARQLLREIGAVPVAEDDVAKLDRGGGGGVRGCRRSYRGGATRVFL